MKYLALALIAVLAMTGCEQKPGYIIDEKFNTKDYYEKDNCVFFNPSTGCGSSSKSEMKSCGDYEIRPINGAQLKPTILEEYESLEY